MEEWKKIQKTYRIREIIGITGMIMSIIIGAICDWNVLVESNILIPIDDIEGFSLTILQVQATVGTLIFTIIALITGNISDSYMGVSISDFYLNLKPWKLTQKVLIVVSLGLSLAGAIFHSLGLYNIVFYLFIATLIAILISILEMYSAFKGRNKQNQEIEAYDLFYYGKYLVKDYSEQVYELCYKEISESCAQAKDRREYKKITKNIAQLIKWKGNDTAKSLIEELMQRYPRKPALLDELEKVEKKL